MVVKRSKAGRRALSRSRSTMRSRKTARRSRRPRRPRRPRRSRRSRRPIRTRRRTRMRGGSGAEGGLVVEGLGPNLEGLDFGTRRGSAVLPSPSALGFPPGGGGGGGGAKASDVPPGGGGAPSTYWYDEEPIASESAAARKHPRWIPDDDAPKCMLCKKDFGRMSKHHCRYCGWVVCKKGCWPYEHKVDRWLSDEGTFTKTRRLKGNSNPHQHRTKKLCIICHNKAPAEMRARAEKAADEELRRTQQVPDKGGRFGARSFSEDV
jgi:hypothetical protein